MLPTDYLESAWILIMNESMQIAAVDPDIRIERRSGKDRRKRSFRFLSRPFSSGRRRMLRRQADRRRFFLFDYYSPKLFYAMVLVLLLSVVDALLTLLLISEGAQEMNPVMAYFLALGPNVFLLSKYLITAASVAIVVLLNYIGIAHVRFPMGDLLQYFAGCFAAVVIWETVLFVRFIL
jgi:hypothetical protein